MNLKDLTEEELISYSDMLDARDEDEAEQEFEED